MEEQNQEQEENQSIPLRGPPDTSIAHMPFLNENQETTQGKNLSTKPLLFPFQEKGVEFLLSKERCLLADDMGTGKTLQTLKALESITGDVLIICPASLCLMWRQEIEKWFNIEMFKSVTSFFYGDRFTICSYNYLQKRVNVEKIKKDWSIIVGDEFHYCKNTKSKTYHGFSRVIEEHNGKIWMLTGTPATRSGQDYYVYLETTAPGKWGTLYGFSEMFCNSRPNIFSRGRGKIYEGVKESKKELLKHAFRKIMLRRKKEDVLTELPEVLSKYLPIEIDSLIVGECLKIDSRLIKRCIETGVSIPSHIASLMTAIGIAKVEAAVEFIQSCNESLVVFCSHVDVVRKLKKVFINAETITGDDTAEEKNQAVSNFQSGKSGICICNIRAGGVGFTLHRASHVLFVELDWSPAVMEQGVGRVLRIGQKAPCVNLTYLIGHKTIDETILEVLKKKTDFMRDVTG